MSTLVSDMSLIIKLGFDTDVPLAPHIGHLYSLILADIFKRWATLQGKRAILCTGTDEHGLKVGYHSGINPEDLGINVASRCSKLRLKLGVMCALSARRILNLSMCGKIAVSILHFLIKFSN